jgi:O-antigen/teichoic acid export membrane protein
VTPFLNSRPDEPQVLTSLKAFVSRVVGQKQSEVGRSVRNVYWSILDYVVLPAALLVLTPFFVNRLGSHQFGIWVLANALTGLTGVFGFGLAGATIKFVSLYTQRGDWESTRRVVRSTLTLYGSLGLLTCLVVVVLAPVLVSHVFHFGAPDWPLAIASLRLAGLCFVVRMVQEVLQAAVQGCHRFDISARINILSKMLTLLVSASLVFLGRGLVPILCATIFVSSCSTFIFGLAARKLISGLSFQPLMQSAALKEVMGFGIFTWLQGLAGTVFAQADVFLVAGLLGPDALTIYSVCQRLAMQIHSLMAAASAFLFPFSSAAVERSDLVLLRTMCTRVMSIVAIAASALGMTLFIFSHSILTLWMNAQFASNGAQLLKVLALAYSLLAMSVVPYQVLNGTGFVRENTLFAWFTVISVIGATLILVPSGGLIAVGWAKLVNLVPLLVSLWFVERKVLKYVGWNRIFLPFVTILTSFGLAGIVVAQWGDPNLSNALRLGTVGVVGLLLAFLATAGMYRFLKFAFRVTA